MFETIPQKTAQDLAAIVQFIASASIRGLQRVAAELAPHLRVPGGMEMRSRDGALYSGIVLIEANDVTAGFVVLVGPRASKQETPIYQPRWRDGVYRTGCANDQCPVQDELGIEPYNDPDSWPR